MDIDSLIKKNVEALYATRENTQLEFLSTGVLTLNLLFSGRIDGGIPLGKMAMMAAPSMLGKSLVGMHLVKSARKKGMSVLLIDTEKSFDFELADALGIDINNNEVTILQDNSIGNISKAYSVIKDAHDPEDRKNVFVIIDSWGNILTSKVVADAAKGEEKGDMGGDAKMKNRLTRLMLGSGLTTFIINHIYTNPSGFGLGMEIPGGHGGIYNCGSIVLGTSRAKDEDSKKELHGRIVTAMTFKSRYGKDGCQLKYRIKYDGKSGLDTFYGLLDDALEGGYVEKPANGRYTRPCVKDDKSQFEKNIYNSEFWLPVFKNTDFKDYLEKKYTHNNDFALIEDEKALEEINAKETA